MKSKRVLLFELLWALARFFILIAVMVSAIVFFFRHEYMQCILAFLYLIYDKLGRMHRYMVKN
jgi:hypothetical protein